MLQNVLPQGGQVKFVQGMVGITDSALYRLMKIWNEISVIFGDLLIKQVGTQSDLAKSQAHFNIELGKHQFSEYFAQGLATIVGGGLTFLMGAASFCKGMRTKNQGKGIDDAFRELGGGKEAKIKDATLLEDEMDNYEDKLEKLLQKKDFSKGLTQEEREVIALSRNAPEEQALRKSLEEKKAQIAEALHKESNSANMRMTAAQALGNVSTGTGSLIAAGAKEEQGRDQANVGNITAASSMAEQLANQQRSNAEKSHENADQITSSLNAISSANRLTS